jgi:exonuclease SbcC
MIPLKLSLHNFLSYREGVPTLDFAGVRVACLCGPNGHGKSALLDAITWALWGTARGKTLDDLISYGADECRVELDFAARGQCYRAVRRRRRARNSDLQLMVLDGGEPRPITGNTLGDTQAQINRTIGMDYDTFVNSAFLVQGRAGEFTNKTPGGRKEVLGKILGLETYERLQADAKERGDSARAGLEAARANTARMRDELALLANPAAELAGVEQDVKSLSLELEQKRAEKFAVLEQVASLRRRLDQQEELGRQLESRSKELAGVRAAEETARKQVREYQELADQVESIQQGAEQLAEARQRLDALESVRAQVDLLERERTGLSRDIDVKRARLESDLQGLQARAETLLAPKARGRAAIEAELVSVQSGAELLEEQDREIAAGRETMVGLASEIGQVESAIARCVDEGKELRNKLQLLQHPSSGGAVCPLCLTPLSEDGCYRLAGDYENEIQAKLSEHKQASKRLDHLKERRSELEIDLPRREDALAKSRNKRQLRIRDLEAGIEDARAAQVELDESAARMDDLQGQLGSGAFALQESARLRELDGLLRQLDYDDQARQHYYQQTQQLAGFEARQQSLRQAEESLPAAQENLERTVLMARERSGEIDRLGGEIAAGETALAELTDLEFRLDVAEGQESAVEQERERALARQGYLQGQVERKGTLEREVEAEAARLARLEQEQSVYRQLQTAFGRQGVQAMLIETALPRLEDYANELLGRMTDNRMHVKLESQREAASGRQEPRETLEVHVSDELGPRPYEMYSGGEAFRVNLALRIALSKVLAHRTGAPLPTLFIDEGFGTQDAVGRERVLDVISAIGDDFEMVIVITHLDDLKEAFPVRIEVQKDANGSTFQLS